MNKYQKIVTGIFLAFIFLCCGLFRDFVFVNVNEAIRLVYYHVSDSVLHPSMTFLGSYSYSTLYYFKWFLTFFFTFVFMLLSMAFIKLFFPGKKYMQWTIYMYAFLLIVSAIFWVGGYFTNHSEKGYLISRSLMGMAQGPIVLMVLIPAFRLFSTNKTPDPAS